MKNLITTIEKKENPREPKFQHDSSTRPNSASPLAGFHPMKEGEMPRLGLNNIRKLFAQNISIFWLLALLSISICVSLAPRFGFYLEDAQAIFFPLILFSFFMVLKKAEYRVPSLVICLCILAWGHSALKSWGIISLIPTDARMYISRLSNDDMDVSARDLKTRVNEIAATYHLSTLELLPRSLMGTLAQKEWLRDNPHAQLIISGNKDWLLVTTHAPFPFLESESRPASGGTLRFLEIESNRLGLRMGIDYDLLDVFGLGVSELGASGAESHLLLSSGMFTFSLPSEPTELSRHFLAWLAAGLDEEEPLSHVRLGYLYEAQQVLGLWKSSAPLAVAHFFSALSHLALGLQHQTSLEQGEVSCALDQFGKALAKVRQKYEPELYASFFNNAAVTKLVVATSDKDYKVAETWLLKAARTRTKQGEATQGAKLALLNLITLTRTGLL